MRNQQDVRRAVDLDEVRAGVGAGEAGDVAFLERDAHRAPVVERGDERLVHGRVAVVPLRAPQIRLRRDPPLADDGDVRAAVGEDERGIAHRLHALPVGVDGGEVVRRIVGEHDARAFAQVERDVALQVDRARAPVALRHHHTSAARGGARRDRLRESRRVLDGARHRAVVRDRELARRYAPHRNVRHLERRLRRGYEIIRRPRCDERAN